MARAKAKWIFGAPHNHSPPAPTAEPETQVTIPVLSTADAKKFGLENFGNTCYANSVIQALYFCRPFRQLVLQASDHSVAQLLAQPPPPVNPPNPTTTSAPPLIPVRRKHSTAGQPHSAESVHVNGSTPVSPNSLSNGNHHSQHPTVPPIPAHPPTLFSALRSLYVYISDNPADKGTVSPRAFIDKLKEVNELFRSTTMHQDAHEFLNYLLNKIVEEIEEERKLQQNGTPSGDDLSSSIVTTSSKAPPTTSSNSGASPQDATLVHKLFEGVLTSETRCLTCETVSSRDESFLDLSIDIEQNSSVTACLRQFSASEMLCQKNKFFCDSCCDLQEAEKRMKIKKLPNVLALHLKRFKYQEDVQKYIKLAYRVAFPFELRLFNTVDDTDDADRLYELFGIVVHIGNGPHHGHYISIIKTLGTWLVFDDDNVYPITESEIPKYYGDTNTNTGSAYVLYYQAKDINPESLGLRIPEVPTSALDPVHANGVGLGDDGSPGTGVVPALPPGLAQEGGDSSDLSLSEPLIPVTPSHSSASASPSAPKTHVPLEVNVTNLDDRGSPKSAGAGASATSPNASGSATTPTAANGGKGSKGRLFPGMRRTPSTSAGSGATRTSMAGSDGRKSGVEGLARPTLSSGSAVSVSVSDEERKGLSSSPVPIANGKEREKEKEKGKEKEKEKEKEKGKEKEKPERKGSGWFGKRKSFRIGEKRAESGISAPAAPSDHSRSSPTLSPSQEVDDTQSPSSSAWYNTSGYLPRDRKGRRPSEPSLFDNGAGNQSFSVVRPKSTAGLGLKPDGTGMQALNGYETPSPGSATSSFGSTSIAHSSSLPPPPPPPPPRSGEKPLRRSEEPPPRSSSMNSGSSFPADRQQPLPPPPPPQKSHPEHKRSLLHLSSVSKLRSGHGTSSAPALARPATAGDQPLPPVPPLPSSPSLYHREKPIQHMSNGLVDGSVENPAVKGKARAEGDSSEMDNFVSPLDPRPKSAHASVGLASFAGANTSVGSSASTTTSSSTSSGPKKSRKLSLSTPMLGFGRRDKEREKERERERERGKQRDKERDEEGHRERDREREGPPSSFANFTMSPR